MPMINFSSSQQDGAAGGGSDKAAPRKVRKDKKGDLLSNDWLKRHVNPTKKLFHSQGHTSIQTMSNKMAMGDI